MLAAMGSNCNPQGMWVEIKCFRTKVLLLLLCLRQGSVLLFFFICVVEKVEAAGKISYKSCVVSILDVLFTGKYICCLASKAYELPAWLLLSL